MNRYWMVLLFVPLLAAPRQVPKPPFASSTHSLTQLEVGVQEGAGARAEADEEIKHVLVDQLEAWNKGNLQGYMKGYWRSPDLTFFSGATITQGWDPTLERYQQRYKSKGKEMGKLVFQDLKIDVLGPQAAVVTGKWELTMSDGTKPGGLFTLIVKKMSAGWHIVHDHTSGG